MSGRTGWWTLFAWDKQCRLGVCLFHMQTLEAVEACGVYLLCVHTSTCSKGECWNVILCGTMSCLVDQTLWCEVKLRAEYCDWLGSSIGVLLRLLLAWWWPAELPMFSINSYAIWPSSVYTLFAMRQPLRITGLPQIATVVRQIILSRMSSMPSSIVHT